MWHQKGDRSSQRTSYSPSEGKVTQNRVEPVNFVTYDLTRTFFIVTINGRHKDIKCLFYIFIVVIRLHFFGFCHFTIYSLTFWRRNYFFNFSTPVYIM